MTASILVNQVQWNIKRKGAVADCDLDKTRNRIFGHLTSGWNGTKWVADPIHWTATVPVNGTPAERDRLEFGFIQIAEATSFEAFYAGRTRKEGSIGLYYFSPPAMPQKIILDGGDKDQEEPWYRFTGGTMIGNRIQCASGDHPGLAVPLKLENKVNSYVPNYLMHVYMDRKFWTCFAAKDDAGKITYIGHFTWRVRYDFKVKWVDAGPVKSINASIVDVPATGAPGRPSDPEIQSILNNPVGPRANELGTKAQATAETAGGPPNRHDLETRYITCPQDFWT